MSRRNWWQRDRNRRKKRNTKKDYEKTLGRTVYRKDIEGC
jgi:hypothetical protein